MKVTRILPKVFAKACPEEGLRLAETHPILVKRRNYLLAVCSALGERIFE